MSSAPYATPLHLEPQRSRYLGGLLILMYGGALPLLIPLPLPVAIKLLLASVLVVGFIHHINQHFLLCGKSAVKWLVWGDEDEWILHDGNGKDYGHATLISSYVHPKLVVLNFVTEKEAKKRRRSVVLLADSLPKDSARKLRVRLLQTALAG
ncbi:MAG: hypothetical protein GXP10_08535 [Gammaproteobacteria bacterium]|nr:hypothetical protein [Gammaproteobacteria bacterium]